MQSKLAAAARATPRKGLSPIQLGVARRFLVRHRTEHGLPGEIRFGALGIRALARHQPISRPGIASKALCRGMFTVTIRWENKYPSIFNVHTLRRAIAIELFPVLPIWV